MTMMVQAEGARLLPKNFLNLRLSRAATILLLLIVVGFFFALSRSDIVLTLSFDKISLYYLRPSCSLCVDLKDVISWIFGLTFPVTEDFSLNLSPQAVPCPLKQLGANDRLDVVEYLSKSISSSLISKKSARSLKLLENLHSRGFLL